VPRKIALVLFILVLTLAAGAAAFGQGYGSIAGSVKDSTGGVVPGAEISATNLATNAKSTVISNDIGYYQVLRLSPGRYLVTVEMAGFKKVETTNVTVHVGDRLSWDVTLQVGEIDETLIVPGDSVPLLRSQDAQTGEVVNSTMIRNLPQLNRDPLQLLVLAGNVQGGGSRATSGSDTRINGGRTVGVEYIVDGITAGTGLGRQVVRTTPTTEAVGEFRVITNGISAEYGRMSGGAVEIISRAGANRYHGELFEYNQNDAFNANSWQQNTLGGKKAHFTDNIFGGTFGGPVWIPKIYNGRDKTFFFFNYEGNRRREAGTLLEHSVPTELERKGDFSQTFYNGIYPELYDQNGPVTYDEGTKTWYRQDMLGDGKRIPDSRISPVSRTLLKWVPLPNQAPRPGTSSTLNYKGERSTQRDNDTWAVRIDHQINESQSLFGRFTTRNNEEGQTRWRGPLSTANQDLVPDAFGLTLNYNWTMSPTLLLNARAGGNYNPFKSGNLLEQGLSSTEVPFDSVTRSVLREGFPLIRLTAGVGDRFISQAPSESYTASTTYDTSLALTKILTRQTLKFGYQHRRYYDNFNNSAGGTFSFHAGPVHQIGGVDFGFGSDVSAAYSTAAYMVGINNQAGVSGSTTRAMNLNYHSAFVQDDFKMTSRLTLNLGVRWDMETPVTERFDKLYIWDPDAPAPFTINSGYDFKAAVSAAGLDPAKVPTPSWVTNGFPNGALRIANTPEHPSRRASGYYPWQFAPRLGMAYQINPQTVLRASFGQMFISTTGSSGAYSGDRLKLSNGANAGWHASNDNMVHLISNWESPFQPGQYTEYQRTTAAANYDATQPSSPAGSSSKTRMPYELTWHLGIQRELPGGFLVEANYAGNSGRDLLGPDIIGRFPKQYFTGGPTGENRTLFTTQVASPTAGQTQSNSVVGPKQNLGILMMDRPYFGAVSVPNANIGRSNYHSMNLRAERRMSRGMAFLANYTFSRSMDDTGGPDLGSGVGISGVNLGGKRVQTVDNTTWAYGISPLDETHRFTGYSNYQLPLGRGKRWLRHPDNLGKTILDHVIGGWEVAGTAVLRSGRPVIINARTPNINNGIRVEWTYASFAPGATTVTDERFQKPSQVFFSTKDARPADAVRRFDPAAVVDAQLFTYGTLPPIFSDIRHPGRINYDLSLMKAFYFTGDHDVFLQFRMEASNVFNYHGYGDYNTTAGTLDYGFITGVRNQERRIQMSARLVF
jgi:hypothetical protein